MRSDHFIKFVLGVASSLAIAGVIGLATTMVKHEVRIAILWDKCAECRQPLSALPRAQPPSFWAAFGLPLSTPEPKPSKERHEARH